MQNSILSNQFVFLLPLDFIPPGVMANYQNALDNNRVIYDNPLDYLNSTIKSITMPSLTFEFAKQLGKRKEVSWKGTRNVYDTMTRNTTVTFRTVDSGLNYFIAMESALEHYLNPKETYLSPMHVIVTDTWEKELFLVRFRAVNIKELNEITFGTSDIAGDEKTFNMVFEYNYLDIEYRDTGGDLIQGLPDMGGPNGPLPTTGRISRPSPKKLN